MNLGELLGTQKEVLYKECYDESCTPFLRHIRQVAADMKCVVTKSFVDAYTYELGEPDVNIVLSIGKSIEIKHVFSGSLKLFGHELKKGKRLLWIRNGSCVEITWANWKWFYNSSQTWYDNIPEPTPWWEEEKILKDMKRNALFCDMSKSNRYVKIGKKGFNMTFDELKAQFAQDQKDKYIRKVINESRKILKDAM